MVAGLGSAGSQPEDFHIGAQGDSLFFCECRQFFLGSGGQVFSQLLDRRFQLGFHSLCFSVVQAQKERVPGSLPVFPAEQQDSFILVATGQVFGTEGLPEGFPVHPSEAFPIFFLFQYGQIAGPYRGTGRVPFQSFFQGFPGCLRPALGQFQFSQGEVQEMEGEGSLLDFLLRLEELPVHHHFHRLCKGAEFHF